MKTTTEEAMEVVQDFDRDDAIDTLSRSVTLEAEYGALLRTLMARSVELEVTMRTAKTNFKREMYAKKLKKNNDKVYRAARVYNLMQRINQAGIDAAAAEGELKQAVAEGATEE